LERYAAWQRLAAVFPYVLILAAIIGTAAVGFYIRGKLTASGHESRQQAIERTLAEPDSAGADENKGNSVP
jgi:hypothetical protein